MFYRKYSSSDWSLIFSTGFPSQSVVIPHSHFVPGSNSSGAFKKPPSSARALGSPPCGHVAAQFFVEKLVSETGRMRQELPHDNRRFGRP